MKNPLKLNTSIKIAFGSFIIAFLSLVLLLSQNLDSEMFLTASYRLVIFFFMLLWVLKGLVTGACASWFFNKKFWTISCSDSYHSFNDKNS